jgi:hypothetical protein
MRFLVSSLCFRPPEPCSLRLRTVASAVMPRAKVNSPHPAVADW